MEETLPEGPGLLPHVPVGTRAAGRCKERVTEPSSGLLVVTGLVSSSRPRPTSPPEGNEADALPVGHTVGCTEPPLGVAEPCGFTVVRSCPGPRRWGRARGRTCLDAEGCERGPGRVPRGFLPPGRQRRRRTPAPWALVWTGTSVGSLQLPAGLPRNVSLASCRTRVCSVLTWAPGDPSRASARQRGPSVWPALKGT